MPNLTQEPKETHYSILGISNNASTDEIKKAYRKLSLEYHPDRNQNNKEKEELFKKITTSYTVLTDNNERKKYDISLQYGDIGLDFDTSILMNMFINPNEISPIIQELNNMNNMNNMNNNFPFPKGIAIGQNPFTCLNFGKPEFTTKSPFINNAFSQHEFNSKPKTIFSDITITLLKAYTGCQYPLSVTRWFIENNQQIEQKETIYISIPKGIDNNEIITIKDKGNKLSNTNIGNIEVKINIDNNTAFERNGIDLLLKKSITLKESFCGFSFTLSYLDGREFTINNEAGNIIPQDFIKTIPKLGMQRDETHGNLIIIFNIIYPKQLTTNQIEMFEKIL